MATSKYWMAYANDGVELCGPGEFLTRAQAVQRLKEEYLINWQDLTEDGDNEDPCDFFLYYVQEVRESSDAIWYGDEQYYRFRMGPRGGVHVVR